MAHLGAYTSPAQAKRRAASVQTTREAAYPGAVRPASTLSATGPGNVFTPPIAICVFADGAGPSSGREKPGKSRMLVSNVDGMPATDKGIISDAIQRRKKTTSPHAPRSQGLPSNSVRSAANKSSDGAATSHSPRATAEGSARPDARKSARTHPAMVSAARAPAARLHQTQSGPMQSKCGLRVSGPPPATAVGA